MPGLSGAGWITARPGRTGWCAATQTGDSDFANDAFQSLRAAKFIAAPSGDISPPIDNGNTYRDDLQTIADAGFSLVRLYNWNMARRTIATSNVGLDHINFLDTAASLGLKVVVPVSDWFLSDDPNAWNFTPAPLPSNYDFANAPVAGTTSSSTYLMGYNYVEFNDEQQVKLTGLYQYETTFNSAATGTTSVFYNPYQFSTMAFTTVTLPAPGLPTVDMTVVLVCTGSQASNPFTVETATLSFY